jgi:hypothetical protein
MIVCCITTAGTAVVLCKDGIDGLCATGFDSVSPAPGHWQSQWHTSKHC